MLACDMTIALLPDLALRISADKLLSASIRVSVYYPYMPSEPHGEGDIAVELWKKLEPGEK